MRAQMRIMGRKAHCHELPGEMAIQRAGRLRAGCGGGIAGARENADDMMLMVEINQI